MQRKIKIKFRARNYGSSDTKNTNVIQAAQPIL